MKSSPLTRASEKQMLQKCTIDQIMNNPGHIKERHVPTIASVDIRAACKTTSLETPLKRNFRLQITPDQSYFLEESCKSLSFLSLLFKQGPGSKSGVGS